MPIFSGRDRWGGVFFDTEGTERGPAEDTEVSSGVGWRFRGGRSPGSGLMPMNTNSLPNWDFPEG